MMGRSWESGKTDQRYIVPALLLLGWIVGCSVVVYYVFS
ncbi:sarcoplasmic/endoplasmic reticulum calcium ATPase regulator DWORF isoform X1 [Amblyraja radiata]|nr:sarcoplasmic/endoplasmic reticulum calcium ATPase regulator DWORF isoform X1 [Amblyraja radiata]